MELDDMQLDRARGAVLGSAAGDALGAGYEFTTPHFGEGEPEMVGGGLGNFAPGEWTDDTAMAWCVLDPMAHGLDVLADAGQSAVAQNFRDWFDSGPPDIGNQTRAVLGAAGGSPSAAALREAAADYGERRRSGGNGSLMRTAPIALPYLDSPERVAEAARAVSALTHLDPDAGDACVLWSLAIRHAIVEGEFDLRGQLRYLDAEAAARWDERIGEAEGERPETFTPNGWVVSALQAAWASISSTLGEGVEGETHIRLALKTAIGIGNDTDTVAAIAGGLLGARWGARAIPAEWAAVVHGYPGIDGSELSALATEAVEAAGGATG